MFIKTLSELAYGDAVDELDASLADLIAAIKEHRKKGSLTLEISFNPDPQNPAQVDTSYKVAIKKPDRDRMVSILYVHEDGSLSKRDPRQPSLPFREVARTDVDKSTGEVLEASNG